MNYLKGLAQEHNLLSLTVTFHATNGKYGAHVQWHDGTERRCEFGRHDTSADEAVRSAIAAKVAIDADLEADKAKRIKELRATLAALTGEQA